MSISQEIIDDIIKDNRIPKKILVKPELYNYLVYDKRVKCYKCDNFIFQKMNGIPLVIKEDLPSEYIIEF